MSTARFSRVGLIVAALAAMVCGSRASAQSISPDFLGVVSNGDGTFTYQYNLLLDNNTIIANGKQVAFYDVGGLTGTPVFTPGVAAPASSFLISSPVLGPYPSETLLLAPDLPLLSNIGLTYNSATSYSNNSGTSIALGRLDFVSSLPLAPNAFLAYAANSNNADNGQPSGNQTFVRGPAVPEPGSVGIALGGLILLGLKRARRRAS